jgi:hypothetical protein
VSFEKISLVPARSFSTGSNQWWRWVALPFASIGGSIVGTLLFTLVQWLIMKFQGGYSEDGWFFRYILPIMASAFSGYLWASISYHVAPRGKTVAGVVMVTILGVIIVALMIFAWANPNYQTGYAMKVTLDGAAALVASIATLSSLPRA